MEQVDIVDNNLHILYQTSKDEAHAQGLLHKTVISQVINSKGELLLVKQASDRQDAGQYVSPVGGHVSAGETNEDALRREAQEEIGLSVSHFRLKGKCIYNREVLGRKENHFFLVYEIYSDEQPVINDESESYRYFSKRELMNELNNSPHLFGDAFHVVVDRLYPELRA